MFGVISGHHEDVSFLISTFFFTERLIDFGLIVPILKSFNNNKKKNPQRLW